MKISGRNFTFKQLICLCLYYGFARFMPQSYSRFGGPFFKRMRYLICRNIFKKCGQNVNIERMANFGSGLDIELGDFSDLGVNCVVPSNTIIGKCVMMAPNCYILAQNHETKDTDKPMCFQGFASKKQTIIEDDIWIGRCVTILPGRHIKKGTIIGACCLLSKDFPEYSVVGGNPSRLLKNRKEVSL